jgi:hypothetical protein
MRKQALKSRKKVHAHKRGKKRLHRTLQQREITVVKYKPEVITVEETKKVSRKARAGV